MAARGAHRHDMCQGCNHLYRDHNRYDSGTDCSVCRCSGFEKFVLPWPVRLLVWVDLQTPGIQERLRTRSSRR